MIKILLQLLNVEEYIIKHICLFKYSQTGKDEIEKLSMITSNNEKYECLLPLTESQKVSQTVI